MANQRKTPEARARDLRLAMHRIQEGKALTGASKLTIAAVAREAGVSASLIHNRYPKIAEDIKSNRQVQVRARGASDADSDVLEWEREKNGFLKTELAMMQEVLAKLQEVNAELTYENVRLKVQGMKKEIDPG
ncbi:TetR family transcriptional regulator [Noviherbaspirillum galbum]|uniref:TetR family transcriptional regulator n=1 Tax=Noviherbaspirillum galbum TaxID=2709383 RepID=A0A6B3SM82_9BURK|nr:TetR family transcriptional regulator [Noviherbaspirillum galbum]NEX61940.1 TetR family transcriptional regulator [Noviherbaspirillum galbum]